MTLNLTKSPALFRTLGAGAALLATSFFDLWTVNSGFGLLAMPGPGNFWEFLGSISAALHWRGQALPSVLWEYPENASIMCLILGAGAATGQLAYRLRRKGGRDERK